MTSTPSAMPRNRSLPLAPWRCAAASIGGHDHRAGVHRPAFVGVVEVFAMRRGAVDEGRAFDAELWPSLPITVQGPGWSIAASAAAT